MPKRRSKGDGSLRYIERTGLWRGTVDIGFWPDGRRKQRDVSSKSQAEARRKLEALKSQIAKYGAPIDTQTTIDDWAERWLTTVCRPTMKPNGLAAYESITRTWIVPTLHKKKVAALKPSDVRLVHRAILDAGRSTATARKAHNILSGMLESARMEGLAERNVAGDVVPPEVLAKARGALSTDDALRVLRTAAERPNGTLWWVALLGGLRQSERLGARIESIDFDRGIYNVEWALDEIPSEHGCARAESGWGCGKKRGAACPERRLKIPDGFEFIHLTGRLALIRPKSGRARAVPLPPQILVELRRHLAAIADRPNPYGLIWRKEDGSPYLPGEDEQDWRDVLHAAGLITAEQRKQPKDRAPGTPDIPTTHWARHTTITVLMELGVDAKVIGESVGHVDVKTTRGYQHVSSAASRAASDKLGEHFAIGLGSTEK